MNVLGLRGVGIATDRYDDMVRFLRDVLQLDVAVRRANDSGVLDDRGRPCSGDGAG